MPRAAHTGAPCLLLLHRVRFSLKSDYLPGTRKILTAAPEKQTQLRHGAIRWNRRCTRAPIAELEGFFSFVIPPTTIPDVSCSGSFLFFLADGSDGITLPAHGNKQEMGRGSSASCLRYHSPADLPGATPLYPTVPPHLGSAVTAHSTAACSSSYTRFPSPALILWKVTPTLQLPEMTQGASSALRTFL